METQTHLAVDVHEFECEATQSRLFYNTKPIKHKPYSNTKATNNTNTNRNKAKQQRHKSKQSKNKEQDNILGLSNMNVTLSPASSARSVMISSLPAIFRILAIDASEIPICLLCLLFVVRSCWFWYPQQHNEHNTSHRTHRNKNDQERTKQTTKTNQVRCFCRIGSVEIHQNAKTKQPATRASCPSLARWCRSTNNRNSPRSATHISVCSCALLFVRNQTHKLRHTPQHTEHRHIPQGLWWTPWSANTKRKQVVENKHTCKKQQDKMQIHSTTNRLSVSNVRKHKPTKLKPAPTSKQQLARIKT